MKTVAELRALWLAGDWTTLLPLLAPHAKRRAIQTLNGNHDANDLANDIAQEALVRCWQAENVPDDPIAFVRRVARNLALDTYKRGQYKIEVRGPLADQCHAEALDDIPDALSVLIQDEAAAGLREALNRLPKLSRDALVKQFIEGRSVQSIADETGIESSALRMRLTRARRALAALHSIEQDNQ